MTGRDRPLVEPTPEELPVIDVRGAFNSGDHSRLVADLRSQTFYFAEGHNAGTVVAKSNSRAGSYTLRVIEFDQAQLGPDREDAWAGILAWGELWGVEILWEAGRRRGRGRR